MLIGRTQSTSKGSSANRKWLWFHIVGHSLRDERLVELLGRVRDARRDVPMQFWIVDPKPESASDILEEVVGGQIERILCSAAEYMAHLQTYGLEGSVLWPQGTKGSKEAKPSRCLDVGVRRISKCPSATA